MIQLQVHKLEGDFEHVYSQDEAINRKEKGWEDKYRIALEQGDLGKMPLIAGHEPTVFRLRVPAGDLAARIRDLQLKAFRGDFYQASRETLGYSLRSVEGLPGVEEIKHVIRNGFPFVEDELLDALCAYDERKLHIELAGAVWNRMTPPGK